MGINPPVFKIVLADHARIHSDIFLLLSLYLTLFLCKTQACGDEK